MPAPDTTAASLATPPTHLLYLHGFRSSPRSFKAQRLAAWVAAHHPGCVWLCPQLPPSPAEAMMQIAHDTAGWPAAGSAVLGSSLGGFYATLWSLRTGWCGVAINPAIAPARDLAAYIGEQTVWHDPQTRFRFTAQHVAELQALQRERDARLAGGGPLPRLLALAAEGDELLPWREAQALYAPAGRALPGWTFEHPPGSDHALSDFEQHLPRLLAFLGLAPAR